MGRKILFVLLGILASFALVAPAFAPQTHPMYFLLPSGPESPPAGVLLHNTTQENATVTLKAFNEQGDLLGQTLVTLGPSESKALFPGDDQGEFPKETATVQAESDVPLAGFVVFGSLEAPLEMLPASGAVSQTLDFPYLGQDDSWTTYVLFNPNTSFVSVTFRALDKDGALLAEVPIVPLSPQETRTVPIEELFDSSLLPFVATVRVVADFPITGFELTGSFQGEAVSTAGPVAGLSLQWPVSTDNRGDLGQDYAQYNWGSPNKYHTGLDISGVKGTTLVLAAAAGAIVKIQENGGNIIPIVECNPQIKGSCADHGYGNTVIVKHDLGNDTVVYSQYSHLDSIEESWKTACGPVDSNNRRICSTPVSISAGRTLGTVGCSRYGQPSCDSSFLPHLHFEIKNFSTLGTVNDDRGEFGYTSNPPDLKGYHDPILNLHTVANFSSPLRVQITENGVSLRIGPGGSSTTAYRAFNTVNAGEEYEALGSSGGTSTPDCPEGWYQIRHIDEGGCSMVGNCFADTSRPGSSIPDGWVCAKFVEVISGGGDKIPPTVTITTPTSSSTYITSSSPLALGGTASDNVGVTQVTWVNDRGGSGTASGTTSWTASVPLQSRINVITVTAKDAAGNTGTDTLTTYKISSIAVTPAEPLTALFAIVALVGVMAVSLVKTHSNSR